MARIASLIAAVSTAALLAGTLSAAPAYADDEPPEPVATTINLSYAAVSSTVTVTGATTVNDAITELDLAVDGNDRVSPARGTALVDGMSLVIDVVSVKKATKKQTVKYRTIRKKTKSMMKGHKKVVRHGRVGKITRNYVTTTVNGESRTVRTTKVNRKVRHKIVKVGTSRLNLARWKKWNKIARCESGGRWHINTGNGYYGGLQFNLATWRSAGGSRFAKYPHRATKREQIHVANRLHAKRGFSPWSCRP
jgi:uncharacterized protein YabE (DUF348 family)